VGVAVELEIPFATIQRGLAAFTGVQRRFQVRGHAGGVTVVDDYGHHPAEIRATLAAARAAFGGRVIVIFQPHRYTRAQALFQEFLSAFDQADTVIVMDVYAAGEAPLPGVSAAALADGIRVHGPRDVSYLGNDRARILAHVTEVAGSGDLVLTLGAGDVGQLGPEILRSLEANSVKRRATC
jgi:UDP-N-acetylmuramate--alanine ligase